VPGVVIRNNPAAETTAPRVEPSPATRLLVRTLTQLDLSQGPLTPDKAAEWKQNLNQLTLAGRGGCARDPRIPGEKPGFEI